MKHLLALVILLLQLNCIVLAVPARSVPFIAIQPDGSKIVLTLVGDEKFHYYLTDDGVPVLQIYNEGCISYSYATIKEHTLIPSNIMAHSKEMRTKEEKRFVASQIEAVLQHIEQKKTEIHQEVIRQSIASNNQHREMSYFGRKKGLVILVNFSDLKMFGENPTEEINRQFNEIGYNDNGHAGSVHDYFYDQSYGQFDLTFDVVGPINVSHEVSYYGRNDYATGRNDIRIGRMVAEACRLADKDIDYSHYDWNGDGEIEQVFLIYAGYGEATGGAAYTIWPHQFSLDDCSYWGDGEGALSLDGVKIDKYACSCELSGSSGKTRNGIGTVCHEFSHCLGLPDLYDVNYSGSFGMNKWDIMDAGSYSGPSANGEIPYGYSAYEKAYLGWLELVELGEEDNCIMPPINETPIAYKISNRGNADEFFILENHQSYGWYSYVGTHIAPSGMMITHIDYDEKAWKNNNVNTIPHHMRESIVPADKSYGTYLSESKSYIVTEDDFAGDLFPGKKNAVRFSSKSYYECGGKLFNENIDGSYNLNVTIDNIKEYNGIISFTIGENLETPKNIVALHSDDGKLYIQWDAVFNAKKYSVEILNVTSVYPYRIERKLIEEIYDAGVVVEDFDYGRLVIRIKAENDFVSSEWSENFNYDIGVNGINSVENDNPSKEEYYTISGSRINLPTRQGLYIKVDKNRKKKIFICQ